MNYFCHVLFFYYLYKFKGRFFGVKKQCNTNKGYHPTVFHENIRRTNRNVLPLLAYGFSFFLLSSFCLEKKGLFCGSDGFGVIEHC